MAGDKVEKADVGDALSVFDVVVGFTLMLLIPVPDLTAIEKGCCCSGDTGVLLLPRKGW